MPPKNHNLPHHSRGIQLPAPERRLVLAFGDLIAVNAAVLIALRVWAIVGDITFDLPFVLSQFHWFLILSALWLTLASANDFYDLAITAHGWPSTVRLIQITLLLLVVYLVIFFFSPRDALPRLFIFYYAAASTLLISAWRAIRLTWAGRSASRRRVVVVGTGWEAETILQMIREQASDDYEVVGVVDEGQQTSPDQVVVDVPVVGSGADLVRIVEAFDAREVVLATGEQVDGQIFQALMDCYELNIPVTPMPILFEQLAGRVPVEYVRGHWKVVLPTTGRSPFDPYPLLKRLMDITLSLLGLAVFALLLPILAPAILIDRPGPIFYRQERVGRAGRVFWMVKLRTMIPDAERSSGPLWAVRGDPRITHVGRFLRRSRLDELPQFWNILRGDMSLVGPRPERPYFVERLQRTIPFYRARLAVRPGATGWAQVRHGYGSSEEDALIKLQYDLYYIRHRTLLLDLMILLRTVGRVVRMQGT
jgi:exopolysaccharide biosynthesis polyprenyl glycosylphosphotransferase